MSDTRETALAKLDALVEGLADQQAMPDDSHRSRYQAIRAALAASPAPTLAQWQPIATAPRDGTVVDLSVVFAHGGRHRMTACQWSAGEWIRKHDDRVFYPVGGEPTHWMPLPDFEPAAGE